MKVPVRNQSIDTRRPIYNTLFSKNASQARDKEEDCNTVGRDTRETTDQSLISDTLLISKKEDLSSEERIKDTAASKEATEADALKANSEQDSERTGAGGLNISCSIPDDTTGQLAAMLARAETKMDVQQVSSKAVRALSTLKMASVFAEGDDAKKVTQRIRRMEKLINRISKKQQHLNKEEVLEMQRKSAESRKEMKRARELESELSNKRTKRRRDERNYASKELARDEKEASQEMIANMAGAVSSAAASAPGPDLPAMADLGAAAADISVAEGASLDITV